MKRYPCPHCGRATIPLWRRLCLGPAWPTICSDCGRRVGVPWWSVWLVGLYGVMGAGFGLWLTSDPTRTTDTRLLVGVLFLSAFALLLVAWVRWVPLIKR
jgi:hypothetical protein